jgi:hypothetical protein
VKSHQKHQFPLEQRKLARLSALMENSSTKCCFCMHSRVLILLYDINRSCVCITCALLQFQAEAQCSHIPVPSGNSDSADDSAHNPDNGAETESDDKGKTELEGDP